MNKVYDDREWLYNEYVTKDRTLKEIAEDFGVSITPIHRRIKKYGIEKPSKPSDNNTYVTQTCLNCTSEFKRKLRWVKRRQREGSKNTYCSMDCLYEYQRGRPNPNKARVREDNGFWKGGVTTVNENARDILEDWKKRILKEQNYTCYVTGKRGGNLEVHHVNPFHKLRDRVLVELNIEGVTPISEYSPEQIKIFRSMIKELHETEEGKVLNKEVHKKFHSIYGFDTTIGDLEDFKENFVKD